MRKNYAPWISDETKQLQKARDLLKKEAINEQSDEKFKSYKKLRNYIVNRLESDRLAYYRTKFYADNPSTSDVWRQANNYLNTSSSSNSSSPSLIVQDGKVYTKPRDIANAINDAFIKKVSKLCEKVTDTVTVCPLERLRNFLAKKSVPANQFELKTITKQELRQILRRRKGNRSSGIDYIDGFSIKLAAPLIEDVLLHLVNLSIQSISYPSSWKFNKVIPHFKKGDRMLGDNWRPVSDIVFVSKLVEAAIYMQVEEYFLKNNLWHPNHHGFKANHSTMTAISQIYDLWINAAESKQLTAALLLDLSAAFDVIDHSLLLKKLRLYNFSENAIAWFSSYLSNRFQVVQIESRFSDPKSIGNCGVPQGSLLGPLLFLIFYNDFPDVREDGESILYADDDTDNVSDIDLQRLQLKIQNEANASTAWVKDNRMVCSGTKTKLMIIGTKELRQVKLANQSYPIEILVNGSRVTESSSERLLGMVMNNNLTWESHLYGNTETKGLVEKLSYRVNLIVRLSRVMPKCRLKMMAEGIFFSSLNYGIEVYGNVWGMFSHDEQQRNSTAYTKEDNRKLQILVNKVLRCLTGSDRETSTIELHRRSGQLSVQQRCAYFSIVAIRKILQHQEPFYHYSRFSSTQRRLSISTRSGGTQCIDYRLSLSRCSFFYRSSRLYSYLPLELRTTEKLEHFKKKLKEWVQKNVPIVPT